MIGLRLLFPVPVEHNGPTCHWLTWAEYNLYPRTRRLLDCSEVSSNTVKLMQALTFSAPE